MTIDEYLDSPEKRILYENKEKELRKIRSKNSPWSIAFYLSRGFTEENAKIALEEKQKSRKKQKYSPATSEFYIKKGCCIEEASRKAKEYRKKIGKCPTKESLIDRYGLTIGNERWNTYQRNLENREFKFLSKFNSEIDGKIVRAIKKGHGDNKKVTFSYNDFGTYSRVCRLLTSLTILVYRDEIDPTTKRLGRKYGKNGFTVDHKFSIYGGFYHHIDPFKIASKDNLRVISNSENCQKSQFCVISLDEVLTYKTIFDDENIQETTKEIIRNVYC